MAFKKATRAFCIGLIRWYRYWVSPLLGPRCRFSPSCSEFALACYSKYPLTIATKKTVVRICKCNPWHPGGVDSP